MSNESTTNTIGDRQNSAGMIKLLRARSRIYSQVKGVQRLYFFFIFVLPIISLIVALQLNDAKPYVSFVALLVGAVDVVFIDQWRKHKVKTAARLQEQFDCDVLNMPWNQFTAGAKVSAEEVSKLAKLPFDKEKEDRLRDWYPANSRDLPAHLARLVCQRTNLWYDSQLRKTYRNSLVALAVSYFVCLLGFARNFTVAEFILIALVPFGPFFIWIAREYHRQNDTIVIVDRLLLEIDGSLEKFPQIQDSSEAHTRSRQLQDAIFAHRSSSPLVSDLVYRFKRTGLEEQMHDGAEAFIDKVQGLIEKAS